MAYDWLDAIRNDPDPNQQKQGNAWLLQQIDKAQDPEQGGAGTVFTPDNIQLLARHYLGRDIQSGADFNLIMQKVNESIAGQPGGTPDATGIFSVPKDTPWYRDPGVLIPGLALGGTLAGVGGAFAGAGGATADSAGLAQMAADAGLTGQAATDFVASGGTLGSTAVGGGGVGLGAGLGGSVDSGFFPDVLDNQFLDPWDLQADPTIMNQPNYIPDYAQGVPTSMGAGDDLTQLFGKLFGPQGPQGGNSSIFGNRGVLGTGLALAPSLAAIAYAKNQGPFDTSRLENAYSQIDPNSLALPYDIQTGRGRDALTSSLSQRNVMGSSFGNQDLASYDFLRHAGRQNILTSGAQAQAGIGGQILDAQVKERALKNDLMGRALLALSTGLNPPQTNINVGIPGAGSGGGGSGNSDILKLLGLGSGIGNLFGG